MFFLVLFWVLVVLFFWFLCVSVLLFCTQYPKWLFSCIFRGFCLFWSHKRPVLNCLCSSYLLFLLLSCLSKIHFLLCFLSINPFLEKTLCGVSFVFLLLAFSFPNVLLVCLKQTLLTSPFTTQVAFIIGSLFFSSVVLVFVFMVYVSAFLFLCWLVLGILLFFICVFAFVLLLVLL